MSRSQSLPRKPHLMSVVWIGTCCVAEHAATIVIRQSAMILQPAHAPPLTWLFLLPILFLLLLLEVFPPAFVGPAPANSSQIATVVPIPHHFTLWQCPVFYGARV